MLVNNAYNIFTAAAFDVAGKTCVLYDGSEKVAQTSVAGNAAIFKFDKLATWGKTPSSSNGNCGVIFGDSDEAESLSDYSIRGNAVSSGLSVTGTRTVQTGEDTNTVTVIFTIVNNGTADAVIKEVAYFAYCVTTDSGTAKAIMIERTVLDAPLTIPAGGVGQLTYTITVNLPVIPTS